jgi:sugar phosphate isomerase/epimerase
MMAVFSTMILLNLRPLEAVKTLVSEGLYVELDYDNFAVFRGNQAEDSLLREVVENVVGDMRSYVKTIHMPYQDSDINADLVPLESIVKRMVKWLDVGAELGVSIAVFHTIKTMSRDPLKINIEFFKMVVREAIDREIIVAVENRLEKELFGSKPDDLKILVDNVGEGIGVCLDIGHANITRNLDQFLNKLGEHVVELHLHDNNGLKDLHKPPLTGTVDWGTVIQWLRNRDNVVPVFEIVCREETMKCLAIAKNIAEWFRTSTQLPF